MTDEQGVTLIELLIVLAIIVILTIAGAYEYIGWVGKYRVEEEVKKMYSDLMNARARAIARNRMHFIDLPADDLKKYYVYEDTGTPEGNQKLDSGTDVAVVNGMATTHELQANVRLYYVDGKGLFTNGVTMLDKAYSVIFVHEPEVDPDYDCLEITATRVNMGKWNPENDTCEAR